MAKRWVWLRPVPPSQWGVTGWKAQLACEYFARVQLQLELEELKDQLRAQAAVLARIAEAQGELSRPVSKRRKVEMWMDVGVADAG